MSTATPLSSAETIALFEQHVIGNYTRYPISLVRGEGSQLWDAEGKQYLDFFPGWGCNLLGHCPPAVVEAVRDQVGRLIHVPNTWYMAAQGLLAKALSERSFGGQCFFCNSGAEANEAAIKLARLYGHPKRYKIITMLGSFHGRTMGALSATGQPKYHHGVEPLLPGFVYAKFGDLQEVANLIHEDTCAIMVEPIQGEGGVRLPPPGYLEGLRALADKHKLLLIFDEVQTGMGRTGKWFAHQHYGIEPDIMTLAKSLAGGVAAGAVVAKKPVAALLKPGTHAATFGGNPIACRAALAYIEAVEQGNLLERATRLGQLFKSRFEALQKHCPVIQEVRVHGVMIGLELNQDAAPFVKKCMELGLLINCTHNTVLRLLPALNLTDQELEEGCRILEEVLME